MEYEKAILYNPKTEDILVGDYKGDILLPINRWLITDEYEGCYMCLKLISDNDKVLIVFRTLDYGFIIDFKTRTYIEEGESKDKFRKAALQYISLDEYEIYKNCRVAFNYENELKNEKFENVVKNAIVITDNYMKDIYKLKLIDGIANIGPIEDIFNGCLDNTFKKTLPKEVGTCRIHYFNYEEIKEIVEQAAEDFSSKNIRPYKDSPTICLSIYNEKHRYWPNEIHIGIVQGGAPDYSASYLLEPLELKNNKTSQKVVTDFIWDVLKKMYEKNLKVDIEKMELIEESKEISNRKLKEISIGY